MCLYPRLIFNKKFTANKKNGGVIPAVIDMRTLYVPSKCGKCIECRNQKAREWKVRLMEDIKTNTNGWFVTLTFSDESIKELTEVIQYRQFEEIIKLNTNTSIDEKEKIKQIKKAQYKMSGYGLDNEICTLAVNRFTERWRKKYKKTIRHWLISELGHNGTKNVHMHGILWTDNRHDIVKLWKYGFIYPRSETEWLRNYICDKTINYMIKYVTKQDKEHKEYIPKILNSDYIGGNYVGKTKYEACKQIITFNPKTRQWKLKVKIIQVQGEEQWSENAKKNKFIGEHTKETFTTRSGDQIAMPIYWRNKIYTEEERELLWIQKLDKEERWIMGRKIDVSKDLDNYYKALERFRKINKELGYGDDKKNWQREAYEQKQREIMQATRIARAKKKT